MLDRSAARGQSTRRGMSQGHRWYRVARGGPSRHRLSEFRAGKRWSDNVIAGSATDAGYIADVAILGAEICVRHG